MTRSTASVVNAREAQTWNVVVPHAIWDEMQGGRGCLRTNFGSEFCAAARGRGSQNKREDDGADGRR
jgi:hypothetical protein